MSVHTGLSRTKLQNMELIPGEHNFGSKCLPPNPRKSEGFKSSGGYWELRQRLEFPILYPSSTNVHMVSRTRQKTKTGGSVALNYCHTFLRIIHTVFCPFEAALLDFASSTPRSGWMIPGNEDPKSMIHGTGRKKK